MNTDRKKELIRQYKERPMSGGVFRIVNKQNGRYLLQAEPDVAGSQNRFNFMVLTNTCTLIKIQDDWRAMGAGAFSFEVLEMLEAKETQTPKEFREDLELLLELWKDRMDPALSY